MIITVGEDMTTATVTRTEDVGMTTAVTSTEDAGMTTAMAMAGVCIGHMATVSEFMFRRLSTMNRLHRRALVSFSHPSLFTRSKVLSKRKEVRIYEEISGVICSYHVSCDIYLDWLLSIKGIAATSGSSSSGAGSARSARSTRRNWSAWSAWSACASTSTREKLVAKYRGISLSRGYTLILCRLAGKRVKE